MSVLDAGVAQDVAHYAARVRAALADLGADQVDDLTDGLEANLADALADDGRAHSGGLVEEFGTPEAYAAELRAAAGLAPAGRRHPVRDALAGRWREAFAIDDAVLASLRAKRGWLPVEEVLVALRPAGWLLRGWALAQLVLRSVGAEPPEPWWLPSGLVGWVVLAAAVVASVQWGRGHWVVRGRWHAVATLVSAVGAVAAAVLLLWLPAADRQQEAQLQAVLDTAPVDGVVVDGETATNLFVYDADGRPVQGAQIVDQEGRPVVTERYAGELGRQGTVWLDDDSEVAYRVGAPGVGGALRWNAYPLWTAPSSAVDTDEWAGDLALRPGAEDDLLAPAWPFDQALAVTAWGPAATEDDATEDAATEDAATPTPGPSAGEGDPGATAPAGDAGAPPAPDAPVAPAD
ncbi:hypothetical protein, partial [Cellulomonas shaoxiangyii]